MFAVGDSFIYGNNYICTLAGVQEKRIGEQTRAYYVLKPVFEAGSTMYVPVGSETLEAKMRRLLNKSEVFALIDDMPEKGAAWIADEAQRVQKYRQVLADSDRAELVRLINGVFERQQTLQTEGKKLRAVDDRFLKEAEKALYEEFAYVLNMELRDVPPFISNRLAQTAQMQAEGGCKG